MFKKLLAIMLVTAILVILSVSVTRQAEGFLTDPQVTKGCQSFLLDDAYRRATVDLNKSPKIKIDDEACVSFAMVNAFAFAYELSGKTSVAILSALLDKNKGKPQAPDEVYEDIVEILGLKEVGQNNTLVYNLVSLYPEVMIHDAFRQLKGLLLAGNVVILSLDIGTDIGHAVTVYGFVDCDDKSAGIYFTDSDDGVKAIKPGTIRKIKGKYALWDAQGNEYMGIISELTAVKVIPQ